jgi:hypothetical protein
LTRKVSRAALAAGIAIGASGLVASAADAAAGVSTVNYYVNSPSTGAASAVTPQSATVSGAIDTGGNNETLLNVPATGGLSWGGVYTITAPVKWNDGTPGGTLGTYVPVDGIPVSDSSSNVSVTITDAKGTTDSIDGGAVTSGTPFPVSNGGVDNYSDVTFEYDPVSDYDVADNQPGPNTLTANDVQVPTTAGISNVSATIGAFGLSAQNNTGNTPLEPGTKYYYWLVQQAGATDQAVNVDIAAWADTGGVNNAANATTPAGFNPTYKCYPIAAIKQDAVLNGYYQAYLAGQNPQVSYPNNSAANGGTVTSQPAIQGPCIYYFGDTGGAIYYQSPLREFTTPALGKLSIAGVAKVTGQKVTDTITDKSAYKASGTIELTTSKGKTLATGKFAMQPEKTDVVTLKLTSAGKSAVASHTKAKLVLTSNWDQGSATKKVTL